MKASGIILTILGSLFIILTIIFAVSAEYKYERDIESYWSLADKASTVPKKAENINNFVNALGQCHFERQHNALFLKTLNNSYDENIIAVKTLQQRLNEIQEMDVSSFEYQKAIEQITAQEMGSAYSMLCVFHGIWYKEYYFLLWDWICGIQVISSICIIVFGAILWCKSYE